MPSFCQRPPLVHFVFALCSGLFSLQSFAVDQKFACPAEIPAESIKVNNAPDGWMPFVAYKLALTAAGFAADSPEKWADLKPTSTRQDKKNRFVTWEFGNAFPDGVWLACSYAGGVVAMSKKMPLAISECTVIYEMKNTGKGGGPIIKCK